MAQVSLICCSNKPDFLVTYSVSGSEKNYLVCSNCIKSEYFSKYIVRKVPLHNVYRKNFQNEIVDETDENEIIDLKIGELIEQNEKLTEHSEKDNRSNRLLKNKEDEKL